MAMQFLMGISIMIGMITYLFFTPLFHWLQLPLPDLVRWIGVVLDIASVDELPEKLLRVTNY